MSLQNIQNPRKEIQFSSQIFCQIIPFSFNSLFYSWMVWAIIYDDSNDCPSALGVDITGCKQGCQIKRNNKSNLRKWFKMQDTRKYKYDKNLTIFFQIFKI